MAFRIQAKIFANGTELKLYSLGTSHGKSVPSLIFVSSHQDKHALNGKILLCPLQLAFGHYSREEHFGWGKLCDFQGSSSFSWVTYSATRKQKGREEKEERMLLLLCMYVISSLIASSS